MKTIILLLLAVFNLSALADSVDVIVKTVYYEARGEGDEGMRAVASALVNRSVKKYKKFNSYLCAKEALLPKQFSVWNGKKTLKDGKGKSWEISLQIAKEINEGKFKPSHPYTHYYEYHICHPKWARGKIGFIIGNHKFLDV